MQPVLCDAQHKPARMHASPVDGRHVRSVVTAVAPLPGILRQKHPLCISGACQAFLGRIVHNAFLELAWI